MNVRTWWFLSVGLAFAPDGIRGDAPPGEPREAVADSARDPKSLNWSVKTVGNLGGVMRCLAVSGDRAYVTTDRGLLVLDVSNPARPAMVGRGKEFPGGAGRIKVQGSVAYLDAERVLILDVANPGSPQELGHWDPRGVLDCLTVAGRYAYAGLTRYVGSSRKRSYSVQLIDVSDPMAPSELGAWKAHSSIRDVAGAGHYAYVFCHDGLFILDVSDPSAPSEVGRWKDEKGDSVAVAGGYVYVGLRDGLAVVDVTNPRAPSVVGTCRTGGTAAELAVAGNFAYAREWRRYNSVTILDVSNPAMPFEVGFYDSPPAVMGLAAAGDRMYVATSGDGLRIVDVSNPRAPKELGSFELPRSTRGVVVAGAYAYLADSYCGLRIIDVSKPDAPVPVGHLDTPGWVFGVAVAGGYAYLAEERWGLRVVDVRDPKAPKEVALRDTPGWAFSVAVVGEIAYVADGREGGFA